MFCIKNLSNRISYLQSITNGVDFLDCFKNRFRKIIVELAVEWLLGRVVVDVVVDGVAAVVE